MKNFCAGFKQRNRDRLSPMELLENRQLFSASVFTPLDVTSPVAAVSVNAILGKKFHDVVGNWTVAGLPAKGSGTIATAIVDWGDGKTSKAKFVDDGSGVVQIVGSHVWAKTGTFQTSVKVEEAAKKHPHDLTEIGEAAGSAVVTPKPTALSLKGTFTGSYTTPIGNPDARSYVFTGTGTAGTLGAADLSGSISPPGFIKSAPATGELTFTAANGTVTIDLTGHPQNGGSPIPTTMKYTVVSGTGSYANVSAKGTAAIALDTTANTFIIVVH